MNIKWIQIEGFKSFGKKQIINFLPTINGIVGPNGSGKSNISDAIRWVFGSNNKEALRTNDINDIIFKGNEQNKANDFAEVKIVFDNSDGILPFKSKEVEICKVAERDEQKNEYYINKNQVRLKDIQNLLWDVGVSKNSLALISQGKLTEFIVASPEKKRVFFEEAAGIAKYRQRKVEASRKLERTQTNLEQAQHIIDEAQKNLNSLEKQAAKAKKYLTLENELQKIELPFLVKKLENKEFRKNKAQEELNTNKLKCSYLDNQILSNEKNIQTLNLEIKQNDDLISTKQEELTEGIKKLESLRKNLNLSVTETKEFDYKVLVSEQKSKETQVLRYLQALENNREQLEKIEQKIATLEQNILILHEKKIHLEYAQKNKQNNLFLPHSIKFLLQNKDSISGLCDIVENLISPIDSKYAIAISAAIGGAYKSIVTMNKTSTKNCIDILKNNLLGRATFLPLDNLISRNIPDETLFLIQRDPGFLGKLTDFIKLETKYEVLASNLLGRYLLTDSYDAGKNIFEMLNKRYYVVSLDGTIFNPNGSIVGGSTKPKQPNFNSNELNVLERINANKTKLKEYNLELGNLKQAYRQLDFESKNINNNINNLKKDITAINYNIENISFQVCDIDTNVANLIEKNEKMKAELSILHTKRMTDVNAILKQETTLKQLVTQEKEFSHHCHKLELEILELNSNISKNMSRLISNYKMTYESAKSFVSQKFTNFVESDATETMINDIRTKIEALLLVDVSILEIYEKESERVNFLLSQHKEIAQAKNKILSTIKYLDTIIQERFLDIIEQTNHNLPRVFEKLAGHGSAQLYLVDAENILDSGINIQIQIPGKKITNLNLLSGGEKSLVALATLFAILSFNPLPFVILDEAEAALDITNVSRFANYLQEVNKTQFIVITHRPGTMEKCKLLWGVTMEQKGISKVVGISLENAKEIINKSTKFTN